MKTLATALLATLLVACRSGGSIEDSLAGLESMWVGDALSTDSAQRAVVAERSLYAHHFEAGSPSLSPLGQRDLAILAAWFLEHGGELSVRPHGASEELHAARLENVRATLAHHGIPAERIALGDADPGGDGIPGERLQAVLVKAATPLSSTTSATSATSSSSTTPGAGATFP